MNFTRLTRHLFTTESALKKCFSEATLARISTAIKLAEERHRGEIRFAIEAALEPAQVLKDVTPAQRALEVFSHLRVWDTELNSGVLIYLLFADRAVEIVADRGIHDKTATHHCWENIVHTMEGAFARGQYEAGAIEGIHAVAQELIRYFPADENNPNELPNEVVFV